MIRFRWRLTSSGNRAMLAVCLAAGLGVLPACRTAARAREHVERGNRYSAQNQMAKAENEYRNAIEIDGDFAEAYYRLGLLQIQEEHPTAASQSLARAVELDARNDDARLKLGDLEVSSTQYDEAQRQAEAVLEHNGKSAAAHRLLGQIALHGMRYAAAESELQQAIAIEPGDPKTYEVLGLTQLLDAEYGAAEKSFQHAIDAKPDESEGYIDLANFYKGQNEADRAENILREGMTKLPRADELPIALAGLYEERGRGADAQKVLEQVEADKSNYPDGRRAVAKFFLDSGNASAALERYRALASADGGDRDAAKKTAECYLQLGRWDDAEQWIGQHDKSGRDADFRLLQARTDLGALRLKESADELESLISDSPDLPAVHFYLAQVYIAQEQPEQAQQALSNALRVQPGYLPGLLGLGDISLQQSNANAALAYASQVIATSPWVADAHVIAGSAYLMQNDLTQAQRAFELAAGLNPRNEAAQERLGRVLAMKGNYPEAEKAYENSLAIEPDYAPALKGLAETLSKTGKTKQATARIDRQLANQPKAFQLYVAKAEFCIAQSDWTCAERSYQQVLTLNPFYVNGYLALAHVYAATNRPQNMIQEYEAARSKFPQYLPTYILLAQVYEYVGNLNQAQQTYKDALKVDANSYQAMGNLARLYADHGGSLSDALELAQKAKEGQPDDAGVNDTLGWIYYKQGLYRSAIPALEAAVARNPQVARFKFHLGMAYLATGQSAQGQKNLQAALQAGLRGDEARSAQAALQKPGT